MIVQNRKQALPLPSQTMKNSSLCRSLSRWHNIEMGGGEAEGKGKRTTQGGTY